MKRYLIIIIAIVCCINASGQNKKVEKAIGKAIDANETIITDLKDTIAELRKQYERLDNMLTSIEARKFPRKISEEELKKELENVSLADFFNNSNIQGKMELAKETPLAVTYSKILSIYNSLNEAYNDSTNSQNIKLLKKITPLDCHKKEFEKLTSAVNDYRFVMFELARVIKIIDKLQDNDPNTIKNKLEKDGELDFITEDIPYTYRSLERYINLHANNKKEDKEDLLNKLKESCPDAFKDYNK